MNIELGETAVLSRLSTHWLGQSYRYFATISSTNSVLKEMTVNQIVPAGAVLLADHQSQGRGRLNRRWLAPPHTSLLMSILFRPHWPPEQSQWLLMMGSLAAAEAIEAMTGLPVGIKWPNDLVIATGGEWKKVGGLLLEGDMGQDGYLESAVLGIGLNINIPAEQLPQAATPAASLLAITGQAVSRIALLVDFLGRLEAYYETADLDQSPQPAWNQRLTTLGQPVQVTQAGDKAPLIGLAEDTDTWGRLLVRDDADQLHTITAGDVTLRKPIAG